MTIVVNRELTQLLPAALSSNPIKNTHTDLRLGNRRVVHDPTSSTGYGFVECTATGLVAYKLNTNEIPFVLKGGFGNVK